MWILPNTVKWKVLGQVFYRRVHGVASITKDGDTYKAKKTAGEWTLIPVGAVVLIGRNVLKVGI